MKHEKDCLICGAELVYSEKSFTKRCEICKEEFETNAVCSNSHFVCDRCHSADALDFIEIYCTNTDKTNPLEMAMEMMKNPKINLHGPEHHFLIPAALITSYCNQFENNAVKKEKLSIAKERAAIVPGGFCGFYGSCGAGIGSGIFSSIITNATPLTEDTWGFANRTTAFVLNALGEIGGPRCCKRNSWLAIIKASEFLYKETGKKLFDFENAKPVCTYKSINDVCIKTRCPFFLNK